MMINRSKARLTFLTALCLSASVIIPAHAAEVTFLPDIPADQISRDTVHSYDPATGISIVTAPTFDPFEQDNTLAGTAALRTGSSQTTIDGQPVSGGAFLDLKMIYTSPSDDPYDLRGYERAFYVSGEPVDRIRQEVRTLDCASNTTEVVYQDDYYNGFDNYGYLAGLYLLLPRYRGHRGFWNGGSRYRPSAGWSDWRRRGAYGNYGGFGGGSYYSDRGYTGRGLGTGRRGTGTRGTGGRGTRDDGGRETGTVTTGNTDNVRVERHNGRNAVIGGSAENREYRRQRNVVTGGPLRRSTDSRPQRQNDRRNERAINERAERRTDRNRQDRVGRRSTGRGSNPVTNSTAQPINRTGRPAIRDTISNRRANPAGAAPAPLARRAPPSAISRPAPVRKQEPRAERKTRTKPVSKPRSSSRLNHEVDRSFRKNNRAMRGKQLNFLPMLGGYSRVSNTVTTNYRCVREETVTLHIPQDRLDAARFDGMTLVVVDNADRDVPVYLPPNYIEGFRLAAGQSTAYQSQGHYSVPSTTVVTPQPSYQGRYPSN